MPRRKSWPVNGIDWTGELESELRAALVRNRTLVAVLCRLGMDREDVVQECRIEVWRALSLWPPGDSIGIGGAVNHICTNYLRDLLVQCNRKTRVSASAIVSLDVEVEGGDGITFKDIIPDPRVDIERDVVDSVQVGLLRRYAMDRYGAWLVSVIDQVLNGETIYRAASPYSYRYTIRCLRECCAMLWAV